MARYNRYLVEKGYEALDKLVDIACKTIKEKGDILITQDGNTFSLGTAFVYLHGYDINNIHESFRRVGKNIDIKEQGRRASEFSNRLIYKNKPSREQLLEQETLKMKRLTCGVYPIIDCVRVMLPEYIRYKDYRDTLIERSIVDCTKLTVKDYMRIPTFSNLNILLIYYWMNSTKNVLDPALKKLIPADKKGLRTTFGLEQNDSFRTVLTKIYKDEKVVDTCIKYLTEVTSVQYNEAGINNYEPLLEYTLKVLEEANNTSDDSYESIKKLYNLVKTRLSTNEIYKASMSEDDIDKNIAYAMVTSNYDGESFLVFESNIIGFNLTVEDIRNETLRYSMAKTCVNERSLDFNYCMLLSSTEHTIDQADKLAKLEKALELAEAETAKYKAKLKEVKAKAKESEKAKNQAVRETNSVKSKKKKIEKLIEDGVTHETIEELNSKVAKLQSDLETANDEAANLKRQLSKRDRDIQDIGKELNEARGKYSELEDKYNRSVELNSEIATNRAFNQIPIECFISAIKDKKICLVGGNMMFEQLGKYGLDNIKTFAAGERNSNSFSSSEMLGYDLIVVATSYIDHSSKYTMDNVSKANNTPILYFNNRNVDMLIYSIFEELYK